MPDIIFEADTFGEDPIGNAFRLAAGFAARQLLNNEVPAQATIRWATSGNALTGRLTDQIDTTISIDGREIELADIVSLTINPIKET